MPDTPLQPVPPLEAAFPARVRLRLLLPGAPEAPPLREDPVLFAARCLRGHVAGSGPGVAVAGHPVGDELERQRRLLLDLLASDQPAVHGSGPPERPAPVQPPAIPAPNQEDAEARALVERMQAFHAEWRQLLTDEDPAEAGLAAFAHSPYLDLLERRHERLWLLVDRDGCLLRAGRPALAPEPLSQGLWLMPEESADGRLHLRRAGWDGRGPWLAVPVDEGRFLVSLAPLPERPR